MGRDRAVMTSYIGVAEGHPVAPLLQGPYLTTSAEWRSEARHGVQVIVGQGGQCGRGGPTEPWRQPRPALEIGRLNFAVRPARPCHAIGGGA